MLREARGGSSGEGWTGKARGAPAAPGVYLMKDAVARILYIGKAKSLKSRLRSYLDPRRQGPRTALMLSQVRDLEILVTDSELEALILENNLIKKWRPKYNITLRDDKTYPFLRLSVGDEFPALSVVRRPVEDGARYFGPYVPAGAMRRTLRILERIYPLRRCRGNLRKRKGRPCLNYQMGRCLAPCAGKVDPVKYGEMVQEVSRFLRGKGMDLSSELRRRMSGLAEQERFEEAAVLRDRAAAIESTLERQKAHLPGTGDMDAVGLADLGERRAYTVLNVRDGRVTGARNFTVEETLEWEDRTETLSGFLRAFYDEKARVPREVLLPEEPEGAEALAAWLREKRGGKVALKVPVRGHGRSLVAMAAKNALRSLEGKEGHRRGFDDEEALAELSEQTGAGRPLKSLAAVDISNISGSDTTASFVWWENGSFVKGRYRSLRLAGKGLPDDYGMMFQALRRVGRRIAGGEWQSPDVLLLDGGRGHLRTGKEALEEIWRPGLLMAIAKPQSKGEVDAVFFEGGAGPIPLGDGSSLLRLLQVVRDEAHRFALSRHRKLRARRVRRGFLEEIPGVGPARRKALLRHFGSVSRVRAAAVEELASVKGIPPGVAEEVHRRLND